MDSPATCHFCGSRQLAANLNFRKEVTGAEGAWRTVAELATVCICDSCLVWVEDTARVAGAGNGDPNGRLGFSYSGDMTTLSDDHCNYCWAQFLGEAYIIDLIPTGRTTGRGGRFRHVGEIRQQRICRFCYAWWRVTLRDPSAVTGTGFRREEGEMGGWRTSVACDTASVALLQRDEFILRQTVAAIGRNHHPLSLNDGPLLPLHSDKIVFICAGRRDRASAFLARVDPRLRARVAIIGRADCMEDARAALRLGALELLSSPLTPQQIVGAMERLTRPSPVNPARGNRTGLPLLGDPVTRDGVTQEHLLAVRPAPGEEPGRAAFMLRRFLRGYDQIGEDGEGNLQALVSCPAEDVDAVLDRLHTVFGEKARVTRKASSTPLRRQAAG